jgi:dihydropteroate synthase
MTSMGFAARARYEWKLRSRTLLPGERTLVMGIVNVTPDSFSGGGVFASADRAVDHALRLLDEGADIVDIGGESTRPGAPALTAEAISAEEEQGRVLPVISGILRVRPTAILSVDTYRSATATLAVEAGAEIVNDVSGGLWDVSMLSACAALQCGVIVMHTRGLPSQWAAQARLRNEDVLLSVSSGLRGRLIAATDAGVARERVVLDPGFGFGKLGAENWALLRGFESLTQLDRPLMAGLSRKGFLSVPGVSESAGERDDLTHTADTIAILSGAHLVRVHDVPGAVRAASIADRALRQRG